MNSAQLSSLITPQANALMNVQSLWQQCWRPTMVTAPSHFSQQQHLQNTALLARAVAAMAAQNSNAMNTADGNESVKTDADNTAFSDSEWTN